MRASLLLLLLLANQCTYYDNASERCKIKEYYNYDGVEYERCYQ